MSHAKREVGGACALLLLFSAESRRLRQFTVREHFGCTSGSVSRDNRLFRSARALHLPPRLASAILLIADVFHPLNDFSVQSLLNGYMRHRRSQTCAMPVFLTRCKPNHIARPDFYTNLEEMQWKWNAPTDADVSRAV